MEQAPTGTAELVDGGIKLNRRFTQAGVHPFESVEWELREAKLGEKFHQSGVEFPASWSMNATNIVAQKYFRGQLGTAAREWSVKQMIGRVAGTITGWGRERGYFRTSDDGDTFEAELTHILLHQMAAFNSPVWFNVGFEEAPQCSACFILSVDDTMDSILDWNTREGRIFRGGSGSGINLSRIRASSEQLSKGGTASGPVSFMRGADAWAGTIKSGGKTRRAAKMVVLDVDHPDIREFIWCKAKEERKIGALAAAGFDMSLDGDGNISIQYQNANNSVRVSDEFMRAVEADADWHLIARVSGQPIGEPVKARELWREIAQAAWECADPGLQYDTTINRWHTCPESGRINASNPCSEYMHVDNSACNLASLNPLKFQRPDGTLDVDAFGHAIDIVFLAQEIIVGASSYPTPEIGRNANDFRQIGMGLTNLGAYLMSRGLAYDSDGGRTTSAAMTAFMTGRAYLLSAHIADAVGPYARYPENREAHNAVMRMHRDAALAVADCPDAGLLTAARDTWSEAVTAGEAHGYRNAQATVMAPTGTISFLMDCDTTGIEPDFSLVKYKTLVGGGNLTIVNRTVPAALRVLGYDESAIERISEYILERGTVVGAPGFDAEHLPVFDTAVGERVISHLGHIKMMAAIQPFVSGAISKTVNMPDTATVEDIEDAYLQAWKLGIKAIAIYRDGSKSAQVLRSDKKEEKVVEIVEVPVATPLRKRMPSERQSITHKFSIGGHEGYITAGMYDDGTVGEIFLTDIGKEGSTLRGMMNAFATSISLALQYGVPLETLVRKFSYMRFEPEGITENPQIRFAKSMPDYIMRWLASRFLHTDIQEELGIQTPEVKARVAAVVQPTVAAPAAGSVTEERRPALDLGPACGQCGGMMQRTGSCYTCSSCGNNTGCG